MSSFTTSFSPSSPARSGPGRPPHLSAPRHASDRFRNSARYAPNPAGKLLSRDVPGLALICAAAFMAAWSPKLANTYGGALAVAAVLLSSHLPRFRLPDVLAGLTAVWALGSALLDTVDPPATRWLGYMYASACLVFIAARHIIRNKSYFITVAYAHLAGCVATCFTLITGARGNADQRDAILDYNVRYGVDGININYTSYTLATGAVLAVVLLHVGPRSRAMRAVLVVTLLALAYGVLLTGSKGATLGLVLGAAILALSRITSKFAWTMTRVCVPVLILLLPFTAASLFSSTAQRLDGLFGRETGDLSGRLEVWPVAISAWMEHPFAGLGPGVFRLENPYQIGPHNLLLTVGTDLGLIGVLLYGSTMIAALTYAARNAGHTGRVLAGVFATSLLPIWLSGHWEYAQGAWLVLALLSVVGIASNAHLQNGGRHRSTELRDEFGGVSRPLAYGIRPARPVR